MMRFYDQQPRFYVGGDVHTRSLHLCVLDATGKVALDKNLPAEPGPFLAALAPFRADCPPGQGPVPLFPLRLRR
jgi:hypothetical protein